MPADLSEVAANLGTSGIASSLVKMSSLIAWSTVSRFTWRVGSLVFGLGGVIAAVLYLKQDSLLYFPEIGGLPRRPGQNPRRYRSPSEHQIPFESHMIRCDDGVEIHSWLLLRETSASTSASRSNLPTLIFFHGNAGNIGLRLPNAIQMLQYLNANILLVEYRGYGDSDTAKPNEAGLNLDAQAALRFALRHDRIDPSSVFVFGRSLGGAVAISLADYAQKHGLPLAGVIVENTFTSISDMVDSLMPYLSPFKRLVLRIKWNSGSIVPSLETPILYLAGEMDQLVPHSHMLKLYRDTSPKNRLRKIHIVPGGTHNETWMQGGQAYWDAVRHFLNGVLSMKGKRSSVSTGASVGGDDRSCDNNNVDFGKTLDVPESGAAPYRRTTSVSTSDVTSSVVGSGINNDAATASAIPIMPSNILDIAREKLREDGSAMLDTAPVSSSTVDAPLKKEI